MKEICAFLLDTWGLHTAVSDFSFIWECGRAGAGECGERGRAGAGECGERGSAGSGEEREGASAGVGGRGSGGGPGSGMPGLGLSFLRSGMTQGENG